MGWQKDVKTEQMNFLKMEYRKEKQHHFTQILIHVQCAQPILPASKCHPCISTQTERSRYGMSKHTYTRSHVRRMAP